MMHTQPLCVLLAAVKVKGKKTNVCTLKSVVISITLQHFEMLFTQSRQNKWKEKTHTKKEVMREVDNEISKR